MTVECVMNEMTLPSWCLHKCLNLCGVGQSVKLNLNWDMGGEPGWSVHGDAITRPPGFHRGILSALHFWQLMITMMSRDGYRSVLICRRCSHQRVMRYKLILVSRAQSYVLCCWSCMLRFCCILKIKWVYEFHTNYLIKSVEIMQRFKRKHMNRSQF